MPINDRAAPLFYRQIIIARMPTSVGVCAVRAVCVCRVFVTGLTNKVRLHSRAAYLCQFIDYRSQFVIAFYVFRSLVPTCLHSMCV